MKNAKYFIILFLSILVGLVVYFFTNFYKEEQEELIKPTIHMVYFKTKYDIRIKEENLLPIKLKNENQINDAEDFIYDNNIDYLHNFFSIDQNKDLLKKNEIFFYPLDNVEVVKTSRYLVDEEFFISRGVSENVAKKSVIIFNDLNNNWNDCLKKLKKIYVGSTFNSEFYSKAIPKLIF